MHATMYVTGEVTAEAYNKFSRRLTRLISEGITNVTLEIISEGGDAYSALAYFDLIRASNVNFVGVASGLVASASTLIFLGCHQKQIRPNAYLMLHEDSIGGIENLQVSDIERVAKHGRRLEDQWSFLLSTVTPLSKERWDALHAEELFLSADDCVKLGIVNSILR